jgi:alcohol dehydrogenase class IV
VLTTVTTVPDTVLLLSVCAPCSKRAFIVTDPPLFEMGMTTQVVNKLLPLGIQCKTFTNVEPDPTLAMVER